MKTKHANPWTLFVATCAMTVVLPLTGLSQIHVDFQNDTIGSPPSDAFFITTGASVTVQNGQPIFGGEGNKSMLINTTTGGYADNTWAVFKGDTAYGTGSFTTEIYGQNNLSFTYIRLGNDSNTNGIQTLNTAVNLFIRWNNHFSSWDDDNNTFAFDQTLQTGTVYTLVINFDSTNETWSGTINGSAITAGDGAITIFDYSNKNGDGYKADNVDRVHFYASSASNGALTYVNNITLIPEPSSTAAIFGLSVLLLVLFRIRSKRR